MLKRNLQEMFLREKLISSFDKGLELLKKNKILPAKLAPYINVYQLCQMERKLINEHRKMVGSDKVGDLDIYSVEVTELFEKYFKEEFPQTENCYAKSMSTKDNSALVLLASLSSYVFCDVSKIKNYVFSSSMTEVLYNLKPIRGNYSFRDFKQGYEISYYKYPDNIVPNVRDIHAINILESYDSASYISNKYIILFKLNFNEKMRLASEPYQIIEFIDIIENTGTENNIIRSGNQEITAETLYLKIMDEAMIDTLSETCDKLVDMCYASSIYLTNPTGDIISAVNEFSKKKTKREYEKNHYTSESFFNVDLNYKLVRAYEQDKEWFTNGHFRLQPVGKDRKQRKLTFVKPHTKHRRLQF